VPESGTAKNETDVSSDYEYQVSFCENTSSLFGGNRAILSI